MLWASGNDYCREWIQQVVALLVGHGAQVIVEQWQSSEQWPNLYWLPLPEVDRQVQGGLVLLPAHLLPVYVDGTIQTRTLQANTPANAYIFWCITALSKTGKRATLHPKQQNRAFCLPNSPEQMGKSCAGLLLRGLRKDNRKRNGNVISHQINLALLHHLCGPENEVWMKANFGTLNDEGANE
ncbi:MAG: hypothetical protein H7A01_13730 [Hahellaceae bacterium]|nr:hypothetical protein [Hahellaceae bacterium]MCP5209619.1 hypothetical protein [Hahellaceae bacterium]